MASTAITIKGNVANISQPDAQRLAAFVLRCNHIVISSAVQADGSFRLSLPRATVQEQSAYGLHS